MIVIRMLDSEFFITKIGRKKWSGEWVCRPVSRRTHGSPSALGGYWMATLMRSWICWSQQHEDNNHYHALRNENLWDLEKNMGQLQPDLCPENSSKIESGSSTAHWMESVKKPEWRVTCAFQMAAVGQSSKDLRDGRDTAIMVQYGSSFRGRPFALCQV